MIRALFRLIVVLILVVGAVAFFMGYRYANGRIVGPADQAPVGTTGSGEPGIDTSTARDRGAQAGEAVARAGNRAAEVISDATLTTKIKSKMALDDLVKARNIDVTTTDRTVTLSGDVHSDKERERAVALARETEGVRRVEDRLRVRK